MTEIQNLFPEIEKDINNGLATTAILKKYNIIENKRKYFLKYIKKTNNVLFVKLKENSLRSSLHKLGGQANKQKKIKRYQEVDVQFGSVIKEMLDNNDTISSILKITKLKYTLLSGYLQWKDIKQDRRKCNRTAKKRSSKRYEETDRQYGKVVEEMINNREHMSPILSATGMSLGYFRNFIKWKGESWVSLLAENSKNFIKKDAIVKSKMGAEVSKKLRIDRMNNIPEDLKNTYITLIAEGKHLAEIKRILFESFNTTEHFVDNILVQSLGKPARLKQVGKNNPMYGKGPSKNAGIGAKGFIIDNNRKTIHFRSSLEMKIYYFLLNENIDFFITRRRIKYIDLEGTHRTYTPDIEIQNKLIEIKPSSLVDKQNNKYKFEAAKKYCLENNMIFEIYTEKHFPLETFDKEVLDRLISCGRIVVDTKNYDKIVKYL